MDNVPVVSYFGFLRVTSVLSVSPWLVFVTIIYHGETEAREGDPRQKGNCASLG